MIYYSNHNLWRLLAHRTGSSFTEAPTLWRSALVTGIAAALAFVQHKAPGFLPTGTLAMREDALSVASVFLAVLVGLRLFTAAQQWRRGVEDVSTIADAARTLTSTACAFVHFSRKEERAAVKNKCQFIRDVKRYILLYISLVFHDCHGNDAPLELRQLLTEKEAKEFSSTEVMSLGEHTWNREKNVVGSANKLRAAIVELWLRRTVHRALRKNYLTSEQAMELNRNVSVLPQMYTRVFNLSNVPIPFCVAQYLHVWLVGYLTLLSATLMTREGWYALIYVFLAGMLLFALDNAAASIECPFGVDSNDVDLEARILCIQDELKVILQAHFHSVGHVESFNAETARMASLSSLLSVNVDSATKSRTRRESMSSSYSSAERPAQYSAPSSTSAVERAVLLTVSDGGTAATSPYGTIEEAEEASSPAVEHTRPQPRSFISV